MFQMAKRSGIQTMFCDFRHATTSSLGIHSRFSHFLQRPVSRLPWNYSLAHKPRNWPNNSEFKFALDHFPSMLSSNFRQYGGSVWVIEQHAIMVSATTHSPTVWLLCWYDCKSKQPHYDVARFKYIYIVTPRNAINIHYQTWVAQRRFINIIRTPLKQWGGCENKLIYVIFCEKLAGIAWCYAMYIYLHLF